MTESIRVIPEQDQREMNEKSQYPGGQSQHEATYTSSREVDASQLSGVEERGARASEPFHPPETEFQEDEDRGIPAEGNIRSKGMNKKSTARQGVSSYWSVPEQQDFVRLIGHFGRDFRAIAAYIGTKTQVMIKNHYHFQVDGGNRPDLERAAREADERRTRGEDIGLPPTLTPVQRRKYEESPLPIRRNNEGRQLENVGNSEGQPPASRNEENLELATRSQDRMTSTDVGLLEQLLPIERELKETYRYQTNSRHASLASSDFWDMPPEPMQGACMPEMEPDSMPDYECCGIQLGSMHELLQHYEEAHAVQPTHAVALTPKDAFESKSGRQFPAASRLETHPSLEVEDTEHSGRPTSEPVRTMSPKDVILDYDEVPEILPFHKDVGYARYLYPFAQTESFGTDFERPSVDSRSAEVPLQWDATRATSAQQNHPAVDFQVDVARTNRVRELKREVVDTSSSYPLDHDESEHVAPWNAPDERLEGLGSDPPQATQATHGPVLDIVAGGQLRSDVRSVITTVESVMAGLHTFRHRLKSDTMTITATLPALFDLSSILREINATDYGDMYSFTFYQVKDDLTLVLLSLRRTLQDVLDMFGDSQNGKEQWEWDKMSNRMVQVEGMDLLKRFQLYRTFLRAQSDILKGRSTLRQEGLGRAIARLWSAQEVSALNRDRLAVKCSGAGELSMVVAKDHDPRYMNLRSGERSIRDGHDIEPASVGSSVFSSHGNDQAQHDDNQNGPATTIAFTMTDEGYHSMDKQKAQETTEHDDSDADSVRTDNRDSALPQRAKEGLSSQFAHELMDNIRISKQRLSGCVESIESSLPELLRQYSQIIGQRAQPGIQERSAIFVRHQRNYITRSLKTALLCRPDNSDVPSAADKIDLLWNQHRTVNLATEGADDAHDVIDNDQAEEDLVPELPEARTFLLDSTEYQWLLSRLQASLQLQSTGSVEVDMRAQILGFLRDKDELHVELEWPLTTFLKEQYSQASFDVSKILCCSGLHDDTYVATCEDYVQHVWPTYGVDVLKCISKALGEVSLSASSVLTDATFMSIECQQATVQLVVMGSVAAMLEIAETLVWLGAACRASTKADEIMACTPRIRTIEGHAASLAYFQVHYQLSDLNTESAAGSCCWHSMLRNPTIAQGYPIPLRSAREKGAEMSFDVMASLAFTPWATRYCSTILLKGFASVLIPMFQVGQSVVWHFLFNSSGERVSYNHAFFNDLAALTDRSELETSRHFVGWTARAQFLAGSKDAKYDVDYSDSQLSKPGIGGLAELSIGFDKVLSANATFVRGKKDTPVFFQNAVPYELQVSAAKSMNVLLYDTATQKGWLLDGASALLHMGRAWLSSEHAQYAKQGLVQRFQHPLKLDGCDSAVGALLAPTNRKLPLFLVKESWWYWEDLIESKWNMLEQLHDHIVRLQTSGPAEVSNPLSKTHLEGFDFVDMLSGNSQLRPRSAILSPNASDWIDFIKQNETINIFGSGFGDLIVPAPAEEKYESPCSRYQPMPPYLDYLAAPMYVLKRIAIKHRGGDKSSIRLGASMHWVGATPHQQDCHGCAKGCCDLSISQLHKTLRKILTGKTKSECSQQDVFLSYALGAIVFGRSSTVLQKVRGKRKAVIPVPVRAKRPRGSDSGIDVGSSSQSGSGGFQDATHIAISA